MEENGIAPLTWEGKRSAAAAPDAEVVDKPTRRRFSPLYKLRVVEEADRCTEPGEVGRLLRREGLYSSHLTTWRKAVRSGWLRGEPHMNKPLPFPELEEERDRADRVKQETPILVILGNPPYNGFASMAVDEERELSEAYRTTKQVRRPEGQGLNDLYVRFFRMAERRIAEKTGIAADPSDTDSRSVPSMRLSVSVKSAPVKRSRKWCTASSESSGRPRGPRAN